VSFADLVSRQTKKKGGTGLVVAPLNEFLEKVSVFNSGERGNSLHASEMFYFCPRGGVLRTLQPSVPVADAARQAKFDIGHAMHAWYQNRYLGPAGLLKGTWRCVACNKTVLGLMPKVVCDCQKPCVDCVWPAGATLQRVCQLCYRTPSTWEYEEMGLSWLEAGIVGHCDGILDRSGSIKLNPEDVVLEMKTITPDLFKLLTDAKEAHQYQCRLYMKMTGLRRGVVIYIDKSADDKAPVKEFEVAYDEADVQDALDKSKMYRTALHDHKIPPRVRCSEKGYGRAKYCDCADLCFADARVEQLQKAWGQT
jgi:hypothetical protein